MPEFICPPDHLRFLAKRLFVDAGEIIDVAIAYLEPEGGGPMTPHSHPHDHLFIVTQGEARIASGDETVILKAGDAHRVDGRLPHAVFNNVEKTTVMVGISVRPNRIGTLD